MFFILSPSMTAVGVVIGAKYGVEYWIYTMTHVYTDDARVKGRCVLESRSLRSGA